MCPLKMVLGNMCCPSLQSWHGCREGGNYHSRTFCGFLLHSKAESKQLWRPRSTSMKDRQNSKAQSDRASSLDSESSPDSRLNTQVKLQ